MRSESCKPHSSNLSLLSSILPFVISSHPHIVSERNPLREQWDGARAGTAAARALFGADACVASDANSMAADEALLQLALRYAGNLAALAFSIGFCVEFASIYFRLLCCMVAEL